MIAQAVIVPLLNPNEPQALVSGLHVRPGQWVQEGESLCTLETTKASVVVTAESEGYVRGLQASEGESVVAGETLCWLAPDPEWSPPAERTESGRGQGMPEDLRITQPALELARQRGVDVGSLPRDRLVTEEIVLAWLAQHAKPDQDWLPETYHENALIIYGAGGHGKSLADLIRALGGYDIAGWIDDGLAPGTEIMDLKVLGGGEVLRALVDRGVSRAVNAVGGVGDVMSRVRVFERLEALNLDFPTLVHPRAFVERSASLEPGVQVFPFAYVGSQASVGKGSIVNTGAVVSHDCRVGTCVNISPGAMLAGAVTVGDRCLIGMGVTINLNVTIGEGSRIGNSAVVKADVPSGAVVRAGAVWPTATRG